MSEPLTGLEWFYALEAARIRVRGLFGLTDDEIEAVFASIYDPNGSQSPEEFRASLRVHESLLTGITEDEKATERLWLSERRARAGETVDRAIDILASLPVSDSVRARLASAMAELMQVGIDAGPYEPWLERARRIHEQDNNRKKTESARLARSKPTMARDRAVSEAAEAYITKHGTRPSRARAFALKLMANVNERLSAEGLGPIEVDAIRKRVGTLPKTAK